MMLRNLGIDLVASELARSYAYAQMAKAHWLAALPVRLSRLGLTRKQGRLLAAMVEGPITGFIPACNLPAREASATALIEAFRADYAVRGQDPDFCYYLATFCLDIGFAWLWKPRFHLRQLKAKVDKALRLEGMHGLYVVEVDILLRIKGEPWPRLMFHIHVGCWHPDQRVIEPIKMAERMMKRAGFTNNLGAPAVDIRRWTTQSESTVIRLASYLSKTPTRVKVRRERRDQPGRFELVTDQTKLNAKLTVRLIEVLSHFSLFDMVGGVGEGKSIRRAWKASMTEWMKAAPVNATELTEKRVRRLWKRVHRADPTQRCKFD